MLSKVISQLGVLFVLLWMGGRKISVKTIYHSAERRIHDFSSFEKLTNLVHLLIFVPLRENGTLLFPGRANS